MRHRARLADEQGFTLIELLVVMLIIGILAAIALPNFLGERSKAQDARAKADARNVMTHVEACFTRSEDYRDCTDASGLGSDTGIEFGSGLGQVDIASSDRNGFDVVARSISGARFTIAKATDGTVTKSCSVPAGQPRGGCIGGAW